MIGALIAYPFVLIAQRPTAAIALIVVSIAIFFALDLAFAELGYNALYDDPASSNGRLYTLVTNLISMFVSGFAMALALQHLGQRTQNPSLRDGVALLALGVWYGIAVLLPFVLVAALAAGGASYFAPEPYRMHVAVAAAGLVALPLIYVSVRLWFAGPRTLLDERIHLYQSWPLTRGRFWPILGTTLLSLIPTVVLVVAPQILFEALFTLNMLPDGQVWEIAEMGITEVFFVFGAFYFYSAQSFIFHRLSVEP
ncbi:MAG: hypothetical protein JNL81_08925 [Hyphomonadaceae bacterium]|nr:hypothetical protein [Hyphomonadaceae bacterium]